MRRVAGWLSAGLTLGALSLARAADPHDPNTLAEAQAALERLLADRTLTDELRLEKLRWTSGPQGPDSQELRLELRHLGQDIDEAKEVARLVARWKEAGRGRAGVADSLYYKFVN